MAMAMAMAMARKEGRVCKNRSYLRRCFRTVSWMVRQAECRPGDAHTAEPLGRHVQAMQRPR